MAGLHSRPRGRPSCRHLGRRHYRKRGPAPSVRHMTSVFREHEQRHASEHPPVHLRSPPSSTPPYISCRRVVARACFDYPCNLRSFQQQSKASRRQQRAGGSARVDRSGMEQCQPGQAQGRRDRAVGSRRGARRAAARPRSHLISRRSCTAAPSPTRHPVSNERASERTNERTPRVSGAAGQTSPP